MWNYLFKKTILSFIFLVLMLFVVFLLQTEFKGDPFGQSDIDPATHLAKLEGAGLLGSNGHIKEPIVRLGDWITGFFNGDWGRIYVMASDYDTIPKTIFAPLRTSMLVAIPSFVLGTVFGMALGFFAGYKRGTWIDTFINFFISIFIAVPVFVIAAIAIVIGPKVGLPTLFENAIGTTYMVKTIVLPILVVTLMSLSGWTFQLRAEVGTILASDYILSARTKGYNEWFIFRRYVLRNAMYPFAGGLATAFMAAFSSSIIVEKFFNIPGSTTLLIAAAKQGEVNVTMANSLIFGFIGLGTQLIAEVAQFSVNPLVKSSFTTSVSITAKIKAFFRRKQTLKLVQGEVDNE